VWDLWWINGIEAGSPSSTTLSKVSVIISSTLRIHSHIIRWMNSSHNTARSPIQTQTSHSENRETELVIRWTDGVPTVLW